jgi:ketosteroid isomerase-like protein
MTKETRVSTIRAFFLCALALVSISSAPSISSAQSSAPAAGSSLSGTWYGDFIVTNPDGKLSHNKAVLIVEQHGSEFSGSIGPTVDQQNPFADARVENGALRFHLNAAGGLDLVLQLADGRLKGTASGARMKAALDLRPVSGLLPHQQLMDEILAADGNLFDAFGACDVTRFAGFLSPDLEFYQDNIGKSDYAETLQATKNRCAEGIQLRRELVKDSVVVNALPGTGAVEAGTHRFYSRRPDGTEHLDATARFTEIWSKDSGTWKLVREISYDHR